MSLVDNKTEGQKSAHADMGGGDKALLAMRTFCVFLIAVGFVGTFFILQYQPKANAILFLIGIYAVIGIFFLLCSSLGICHFGLNNGRRQSSVDSAADILDNISTAIVLTDKKGRFVYGNKTYRKLSGSSLITPEILLARDPEAANIVYRLSRAAETGQFLQEVVSFKHDALESEYTPQDKERGQKSKKSHSHFYTNKISSQSIRLTYNIDVKPFFVGGDTLAMWTIAEVKEHGSKQDLVHNLQDAMYYFDNAPIGFLSWNQEGEIVFYNATLAHMLQLDFSRSSENLTLSQVFGSQNSQKIISWEQEVKQNKVHHKDMLSFIADTSLRLDLEGQSGINELYLYDDIKQGSELAHALLLPSNKIANQASSCSPEVDNNSQAHKTTQRNTHDLDTQVDIENYFYRSPIALAVLKRGLNYMEVNDRFSEMFSLEKSVQITHESVKQDIIHFFSTLEEQDRDRIMNAIENVFQKAEVPIKPLDAVLPGDQKRYIRLYITPVQTTAGNFDAVILSIVEITRQRALEEQMEHSQKMQAVGQLAGGIAHDFNNVLTAIIMSCDLLLGSHRSSDPSHPDIINIKNNAERAASLVRQLLAFSRRQTLHPEVLDLTDMLADLRMLLSRLAGGTIDLKIQHGQALWPVKADQAELERVIVNLVVNARDAMSNTGEITIQTKNINTDESRKVPYKSLEVGEYVLVEVADTGEGIPADILEKIFDPFFTTKEVGKGTGLGLSMVYGIISQTGGHIYCRSTLGQGTVFSIYLPRYVAKEIENIEIDQETEIGMASIKEALEPSQLNAQSSQRQETQKENNKITGNDKDLSGSANVLLVEDEDAVRMGGVKALQSRGYTVFEAASGVEALEVIEAQDGKIDIIVSDVVMPEMDGPTLLKQLQQSYSDIKFIFVSGYAQEAFTKNMPDDADYVFLAKPFSLKQLASTVKEMLEHN